MTINKQSNEESINEESINGESINEESINEESIIEESINGESINEEQDDENFSEYLKMIVKEINDGVKTVDDFCTLFQTIINDAPRGIFLLKLNHTYQLKNNLTDIDIINNRLYGFDSYQLKSSFSKKYRIALQLQIDRVWAVRMDVEWNETELWFNEIGLPPLADYFNIEEDFYFGCAVDYDENLSDDRHNKWLKKDKSSFCPYCENSTNKCH